MEDRTNPVVSRTVMSRRSFLKTSIKAGIGLFGLAAAGGSYARAIEPRWLETVHNRLVLPGLPDGFRGVTIAHFSDVHYEFHYGPDRFRGLIKSIMKQQPDIICFTGDLVNRTAEGSVEEIASILHGLTAPLGKFAVLGNHDYYHNAFQVEQALEKGGFKVLRNDSLTISHGGSTIRMAGVEDFSRGKPNLSTALRESEAGEFIILLSHVPDFAAKIGPYPVSLQLSGHSHGGQMRIPFFGPAVRVPGAKLYPEGMYKLHGGKLTLYTNRGIGVTGLPFRFLCRPELTVHTLERVSLS